MKLALLLAAALLAPSLSPAEDSKLQSIPLKDIDGRDATLKDYAGKVLLVVNVASQCGFTPQYEGLEALWRKYKNEGFVVRGFPSNDFGGQEPGTAGQIKEFCKTRFDVSFPLFEKIRVKGPEKHPLYAELTGPSSPVPGEVKWNFGKFLIGRDGRILSRFDSEIEPDSPELLRAVEKALGPKPQE